MLKKRRVRLPAGLIAGLVLTLGFALAVGGPAPRAGAAIDDEQRTNWGLATFGQSRAIANFSALGWAVEEVDGTVFAGGNFLDVTNGQRTERQPYLAAFDVNTGIWSDDFTPAVGGPVLALEPGPEGSLFVGGEMDEWNGQSIGTLVKIDPETGELWPGWNTRVYGGTSVVRDLSLGPDGWLYAGGTFTTASDAGTPRPVSNVIRIDPDTGDIDWSWIPQTQGGGVWGVSASYTLPTVYIAGWNNIMANKQVVGVSSTNAAQVTWSGFTMNFPCCSHMFDIQATPHGTVMAVGEQHGAYLYDESDNMAQIIGHVTSYDSRFQNSNSRRGGDYQDIELVGDTLYASCHCWGSHSTGAGFTPPYSSNISGAGGTPTGSVSSTIAYDARTGVRDQGFNPYMAGDIGGWGVLQASDGCIWIAGGINAVGPPGDQSAGRDLVRLCEEGFVPEVGIASPDACLVEIDGNTVTVSWDDVGDAVDYVVRRSVDGGDSSWRGVTVGSPFVDTNRDASLLYTVAGRDGAHRKGPFVECDSDSDGDGVLDADDPDDDNDGTPDVDDAFPLDAAEQADADGDGVGDNADVFPNDPAEQFDGDGDGVGDNADIDIDNDGLADEAELRSALPVTSWPVVSAGVVVDGDSVTSWGDGAAWSHQVNSARWSALGVAGDFRLSWRLEWPSGDNMMGLGIDEASASYTDVDYAFYTSNSALYVYESGVYRGVAGSVNNGTVLAIEFEGGQLRYYRDGTLVRSTSVAGTPDFYVDSSFRNTGQVYNDFLIEPLDGGWESDIDGDGLDNKDDLDSDNDTIADIVEAGLVDGNGDFVVDAVNQQGSVLNPPDTDGDGLPDFLDIDSDGDGTYDIVGTAFAASDTNGDGVLDGNDANGGFDANGNGLDDLVEGLVAVPSGPATCLATFSGADVTITWGAADGAASYIVERSVDGGTPSWRGLTSDLSFTDTNRDAQLVYFVKGRSAVGQRSDPTECTDEIVDPVDVLLAPVNCTATVSGNSVTVTWDAAVDAVEYVIYRSVDGGDQFWRGLTTDLTFVDTNRDATLNYFVSSKNAARQRSDRGPCTTVDGPDPDPIVIEAPASCTVTVVNGPNDVTVTWDPIAAADTVYVISRTVDGGTSFWRGSATGTSFDDVLRAGEISYSVVAKVGNDKSDPTTCTPVVQGA